MARGLSPNHWNGKSHRAWTFCPCRETPGTCHTTEMGSQTLILITHFAAEIMSTAFLNQECERPSSRFECHLTADVAKCIRWICALSWHINGEQTLCTSETITHWALASNTQRVLSHTFMTRDCLLQHFHTTSYRPPVTYVGVCGHMVWCDAKSVGDREIPETYLNSASKNTCETDIFPHRTKYLLTRVIGEI